MIDASRSGSKTVVRYRCDRLAIDLACTAKIELDGRRVPLEVRCSCVSPL